MLSAERDPLARISLAQRPLKATASRPLSLLRPSDAWQLAQVLLVPPTPLFAPGSCRLEGLYKLCELRLVLELDLQCPAGQASG